LVVARVGGAQTVAAARGGGERGGGGAGAVARARGERDRAPDLGAGAAGLGEVDRAAPEEAHAAARRTALRVALEDGAIGHRLAESDRLVLCDLARGGSGGERGRLLEGDRRRFGLPARGGGHPHRAVGVIAAQ